MPIKHRNLSAGTVLAGRYKGKTYRCTVQERDGELVFALDDNSIHRSASAAASKAIGGGSVNGWRFWTLEEDPTEKAVKTPKRSSGGKAASTKVVKVIKRVANQKGVPEGSTKWWCSACMKGFVAEGEAVPEICLEGHPRESTDEIAAESPR